MKILYDTNILIHIQDPKELSPDLQTLLSIIREHGHQEVVHPASLKDIENDSDEERRRVTLSKLRGYPILPSPPAPDDYFLSLVGTPTNTHDENDNDILFSLKRNLVDFLITEDKGIRKKAIQADIDDRVFSIASALDYFKRLYNRYLPTHTLLKECYAHDINIDQPFFDSLKEDYPGFEDWWFEKCVKQGRKCWIYEEDKVIKAFLMLKDEDQSIDTSPPVPAGRRVKITTLKVDLSGSKMGELFLKMAFQYCINNQFFEVYLTHFEGENDALVYLIKNYGFEEVGKKVSNGENVYLKKFIADDTGLPPLTIAKKYYPCFKDGENIKKFVIPIQPQYHDTLFPDYSKRQMTFADYSEINIPGNAIKKAYLSRSKIKKITPGSIILFYRSKDQKAITSVGIVDQEPIRTNDADELKRIVGKRSVYSEEQLTEWAQENVFILRFKHHLYLPNPLSLKFMNGLGIGAPQSIREINHEQYLALKTGGKLDERFTVN
ncbi:MAG: hypothetical protein AWU59_162 [Methanolobus sp. T82-4]|nr:MAG: hypothetical protein AWU59_162 [Methanolobus sp. T82-4]